MIPHVGDSVGVASYRSGVSRRQLAILKVCKLLGVVPKWMRDRWKTDAKHQHALDADIASLRSFSLVGKAHEQRRRFLIRQEELFWSGGLLSQMYEEERAWMREHEIPSDDHEAQAPMWR